MKKSKCAHKNTEEYFEQLDPNEYHESRFAILQICDDCKYIVDSDIVYDISDVPAECPEIL